MQKQESITSCTSSENVDQNQKSWTLIRTIPIDGDLEKSFPLMTNQQISINLVQLNLASLYNQKLQKLILQRMKDTQFYLMNRHILQNVINVKTQKDLKRIKQITAKFDQEYVNGDIQKYAQSYVQTASNSYTQRSENCIKYQIWPKGSQQFQQKKNKNSIQNKLNQLKIQEIQLTENQVKFHSQLKSNNEKKMLSYTKKKQYRAKFIERRQQFVTSLQQISQKLFKNKSSQSQADKQSKTNELFQNLIMQLNQKISNTDQIKSTSSVDSQQNYNHDLENEKHQFQLSQTQTINSEIQSNQSSLKGNHNNKISFFKTTGYKFYFKKQYHQVTQVILDRSKPIQTKNRNPLLLDFGFNRFIYKDDDQLSHEIIAMKMIQYFNLVINGEKKNKQNIIVEYEIIPQAKGALYEFVQNSVTIAHIKKNYQNLSEYFKFLSDQHNININILKKKFSQTYAGFCIAQFLLNIKDRNNANIMIKNDGSIFHIDLAFIFQSKPGGINFESVPFKMTKQYVKLMGGFDSDHFLHFQSVLTQIFTKLNQCKDEYLSKLLILSSRSKQIRCFKGFNFEKYCQQKICPNLNKVRQFIQQLIDDSYDNWRTKKYDAYQFKTNKIPQ